MGFSKSRNVLLIGKFLFELVALCIIILIKNGRFNLVNNNNNNNNNNDEIVTFTNIPPRALVLY